MEERTPPITPDSTSPGIGHNRPDEYEAVKDRVARLVDAANVWLDKVPEITDDDRAGKASDFIGQLTAEIKKVEDTRKTEKQPHMDAAKAVDEKYKPLVTLLDRAKALLRPRLAAWLQKKEAEKAAAEKKAREEAEAAQRAAEEAHRKAQQATSVEDVVDAEEAARKAEAARKEADRIGREKVGAKGAYSDRSTGLRTYRIGEIVDIDKVFDRYRGNADVIGALQRCVNADIRHGAKRIPGVKIVEEKR